MTISLARRQKLAAIAKVHDEWVDEHLAAVSSEFDPAAHPKEDSDYNQHNVDVDASGEAEDELAAMLANVLVVPMIAAGDPDWNPAEHPRGLDGKFIDSGITISAPVSVTMSKVKSGMLISGAGHPNYIKAHDMGKTRRVVSVEKLPHGSYKIIFDDGHTFQDSPNAVVKYHAESKAPDFPGALKDQLVSDLLEQISNTAFAKNIAKLKGNDYEFQSLDEKSKKLSQQLSDIQAMPASTPKAPAVPVPKLSLSVSSKAGVPITAWTKTIYSGDYADGQVVAVKDTGFDAHERIVWDADAKKFVWQQENVVGGWTPGIKLTKKAAYEKFKGEKKSWTTPALGAMTVDDAPPPPSADLFDEIFPGVSPLPTAAVLNGDFSGLKQVGAQGGSTEGGLFEATDGSRWYVKSQKSAEHASNEALASALYRAAGIDIPEVIRGSGTPGLSGKNHTATRIIEGAKQNLGQKLNDPEYMAKIREGFALDAWLANWDAVGLVLDNIVEGGDGKPYRIDAGGALLFRAMGDKKGAAFGPNVTEFNSLRDTFMAPQAAKVFGGISDAEIASSVERVKAISPDQIRNLVKEHDMDSSLADLLIDRRENLISKVPAPAPKISSVATAAITSPDFTILPRDQRGKSGDGHFAPKIWGKYGAAGVMMRHVDENGVERFLLVKANTTNSKRWQLPGGALEELETPEQGAAREVHEELGFTQEFLHGMTPIGTHKVTVDVPDKGQWSYSNIAVDVPSRPNLVWDENELGGAKWLTAAEIDALGAKDEIHPALKANLTKIIDKFPIPESKSVTSAPAPTPVPAPDVVVPTISQQNTSPSTTWTKGKFNTTTAYKTSYENDEIVGFTKFGSSVAGGDAARILWKNGKFTREKWTGSSWQYDGAYTTKKSALSALGGQPFYKPHKGTLASENNDVFTGTDLIKGSTTLVKTETATPTINQPVSSPFVVLTSFSEDGTPFGAYKTSLSAKNLNGDKIGAIHEYSDGTWIAIGGHGRGPYVSAKLHATKEDAIQALADGDAAYIAAQLKAATPVINPASSSKKTPKLTAAQIEKQNGTVPKTLKSTQKSKFLKNFKEGSSFGFIKSDDPDAKKVFTALVEAVGNHNDTESPKLNFLQGLNVLDQVYGSKQKANVVAWLQTSEGKALAPSIVGGAGAGNGLVIPAPSSGVIGMKSAYEIGKPKKIHPSYFTSISRADARDMHEEMYKKTPLTKDQISIIKEYMGSSDDFNDPLRGTKNMTGWSQVNIAKLQSVMRPVTKSFTVWRGTDGLGTAINKSTINNLEDLKKFEGAVVGDPAFLSTSIEQHGSFSARKFKLIVNVPEGTPATYAYASGGGAFDNEQEMLLAAGLHFKIDRVSQPSTGGTYHIYMTVVPEAKQK